MKRMFFTKMCNFQSKDTNAMKVIVAHPEKQHSYRTAEALHLNGCLFSYMTTVYDKPNMMNRLFSHIMPISVLSKIRKRKSNIIPDSSVSLKCTFLGLFTLFFYKLPLRRKYRDYVFKITHNAFGRSVAYFAIRHKVDAVIMYDTTANECFRILKERAPHIKRILDVSIANRAYMKHNYENDIEKFGDIRLQREQSNLWIESHLIRNEEEIALSQYFLVASSMSKRSLEFSGVSSHKIYRIPYGVESERFHYVQKTNYNKKLKLIYVGQILFRKGLHHLFKVMRERYLDTVELNVLGYFDNGNELYQQYKNCPNINFMGFVNHENIVKYYNDADAFVFPTLGEGYGLVILEALSCGVPCLVSNLAGGDDAIINGYNGFVFEAGNDDDMCEKIDWCLSHRSELLKFRENCCLVAQRHTWEKYYEGINFAIQNILEY